MKVVNEKGKLFGLINLVDLLLIVAVVVVGVFGATMVARKVEDVAESKKTKYVEIEFTVIARNVMPEMAEDIVKNIPDNTKMIAGTSYISNFYITHAEITPTKLTAVDSTGKIVIAPDPLDRKDIIYTVKALTVAPTDNNPIYVADSQEVRVGVGFFVKTSTTEMRGTVESMTVGTPFENADYDADKPASWNWKPAA